jgi:hypothetical protein
MIRSILLLGLLAIGCGPKEGDACSGSYGMCDGANSALECQGGKQRSIPCRGGCKQEGSGATCDYGAPAAGDGCFASDENKYTCAGNKVMICSGGRFSVAEQCAGSCEPSTVSCQ